MCNTREENAAEMAAEDNLPTFRVFTRRRLVQTVSYLVRASNAEEAERIIDEEGGVDEERCHDDDVLSEEVVQVEEIEHA